MATHEEHGRKLRRLAGEGADWLVRRDTEIRAAKADGMSLRTIAAYMGMSQTGVQKIVNETRVSDGGGQ